MLRLVSVMKLILVLSSPLSIRGRVSYLCDFVKKRYIGLHLDIYRPISFKCGVMMGTAMLYILISLGVTWTFIQGHNCVIN